MKKYFILLFIILLASCSKEAIEFIPESSFPKDLYTFNSATYGFILTIKESGKQYYIGKDKRIVKQENIYSDDSVLFEKIKESEYLIKETHLKTYIYNRTDSNSVTKKYIF